MAAISGKQGKIKTKIGTGTEKYLVKMTSWSIDSSVDVDDASYFGGSATEEGYKEKTPTAIDWSASFDGAMDDTDTATAELYAAHQSGALVEATFYMNATSGYRGTGIIDSYSVNSSADGKVEISANLAGNGILEQFTV